jgi:hypothetical protein
MQNSKVEKSLGKSQKSASQKSLGKIQNSRQSPFPGRVLQPPSQERTGISPWKVVVTPAKVHFPAGCCRKRAVKGRQPKKLSPAG